MKSSVITCFPCDNLTTVVYCLCWLLTSLCIPGASSRIEQCAELCKCLDKGSIITCRHSHLPRLPPLLTITLVLDLDFNKISFIHNDSFQPVSRLEILSLQDNHIMHIAQAAFVSLPELRILRLGNNKLTSLPRSVFRNNTKLQVLDLHGNDFIEIPHYVMYGLQNLKFFNMSYNHVTSPLLGEGFKSTTVLSSLDLSGNNFLSLETSVFHVTSWWDDAVTHSLNLSYCNIRHIHSKSFAKLDRLESLSLAGNPQVTQYGLKAALQDLQVSSLLSLNLSEMNITNVFEFFQKFEHRSLLELYLSHNNIETITQRTFFYLTNLKVLDLSYNVIVDIGDLTGLTQLENINLSHNKIIYLDPTTFERIQVLKHLDLSHNALPDITDSAFQTLWDLHTLDISYNNISTANIRTGLESLQTLYVSNNRITNITFLSRVPHLQKLDISSNLVTRLHSSAFPKDTHYVFINISRNSITEIGSRAFAIPTVQTLDLSYNKLTRLTNLGCQNIKHLHLSGNRIRNLTANSLRGLIRLQYLYLDHNALYQLQPASFVDMYNLRHLDLSANPLGPFLQAQQGVHIFKFMPRLQELSLSEVDIFYLPHEIFRNLSSLHSLDLSGNKLYTIPPDLFSNLTRLRILNLSGNNLHNPEPQNILQAHMLHTIDLSYNPFDCTCDLMPFKNWFMTTNLTVLDKHSSIAYICASPPEWKGAAVVQFSLQSSACSYHERAVIFTALGCIALAMVLIVTIALCQYKFWSRKRKRQNNARYSVIDDTSTVQINPQHREW